MRYRDRGHRNARNRRTRASTNPATLWDLTPREAASRTSRRPTRRTTRLPRSCSSARPPWLSPSEGVIRLNVMSRTQLARRLGSAPEVAVSGEEFGDAQVSANASCRASSKMVRRAGGEARMTRTHPSSRRARRRVARSALMPAQSRKVTPSRSRTSCGPCRRNTRRSSSRSCGADEMSISPQISTTGGAPEPMPTRRSAGFPRAWAGCCPGRSVRATARSCSALTSASARPDVNWAPRHQHSAVPAVRLAQAGAVSRGADRTAPRWTGD
jgi:hypothetical protein